MELPKINTIIFCNNRSDAVDAVDDLLRHLTNDYPWTMTISREVSGDFSVRSVTGSSSEGTEQELAEQNFCNTQVNT